jgi:predicted transcriptional regulator
MQLTLPIEDPLDTRAIRIERLNGDDPRRETERWRAFRARILAQEDRYPGIDRWLKDKVAASLASPMRQAFLAYVGEEAVASAVLKRGASSKICHMHISESYQDQGLGNAFFSLMALAAGPVAHAMHFTLPEGLWAEKQAFFTSFGFESAVPASNQYRLFEEELRCSAPWSRVWSAVAQKLPALLQRCSFAGHTEDAMLLSLGVDEVKAILGGTMRVVVRRRFSRQRSGCRAVLYGKSPMSSLVGEAHIAQVIPGRPDDIWAWFGAALGRSRREFDVDAAGREEIVAIVLGEVSAYPRPVPRREAPELVGAELRVPGSHATLAPDGPWALLASMAAHP